LLPRREQLPNGQWRQLVIGERRQVYYQHNATSRNQKGLTRENRANREGNDWKILFSFLISVCSVFSVLKTFAFFAHI